MNDKRKKRKKEKEEMKFRSINININVIYKKNQTIFFCVLLFSFIPFFSFMDFLIQIEKSRQMMICWSFD